MTSEEELRHLRAGPGDLQPPGGYELDELTYPGGDEVLDRAREVMTAVLSGAALPEWFTSQCVDDAAIRDCELERWSLRAWRYWLEPDNRRWWWWSAETDGERIVLRALVRGRPYLKGSADWLFKASAG